MRTFRNAVVFEGGGLETWITSKIKDLDRTFAGTRAMKNVDLGSWDVSQITKLYRTFYQADKFLGTGLDKWITSSLREMSGTFAGGMYYVPQAGTCADPECPTGICDDVVVTKECDGMFRMAMNQNFGGEFFRMTN